MYQHRSKKSPSRRSVVPYRPGSAKKVKGRIVTSVALTKATKTLSAVAVDTSTQRGNIKVVVRVRPANDRESTANSRLVVHSIDNHMVLFDPPDEEVSEFYYRGVKQNYQSKGRHKNVRLAFDNAYGPESTNPQIFSDVIKPMLDTLLNGFNCSVFAYGATGSGKTHTMLGSPDNPGLTFLTVMELYERLGEMDTDYETEVAVSYLEVYNETVKDLLHSSGDLNLREDQNGVVVPSLTTHKPKDAQELLNLLAFGNSVRSQHPTDHNAESSRSHAVFQVYINLRSRFTELTNKYRSAKLVMVDLAGSERGAATGFQGQRFREGASINKSLLALGNCINALADGKKHIPYRDSKLTRILKDSLGGNCKTVMIANVSPSHLSYDDSYNTLRYADRAKRIKCQVKKNTMSVTACLTQYTKIVEEMSHKIEQLQQQLADSQKNCACNSKKVDAATEPDNSILETAVRNNHLLPIPSSILELYMELIQRKQDALGILVGASTTAATIAARVRVKERRIASIMKFSTSAISEEKNTKKIRNQLKPLLARHKAELQKKSKALEVLYVLDQEWEALESQHSVYENNNFVAIKLSDYLNSQKMKVEHHKLELLKHFYKKTCELFLEKWQEGETIVSKSVEFVSSQYSLTKHFDHNTRQMDKDYEDLAANLCGTHVRFPDELDITASESSLPPLQILLDEDFLMTEDSCDNESRITKKGSRFKRPDTPPRKNMSGGSELNTTYDEAESELLASFASETSFLHNIANYESIATMQEPQLYTTTTSEVFSLTNLSAPYTKSSNSSFNLDETIILDEPSIVSLSKTPENIRCADVSYEPKSFNSILDCNKRFDPVPLFIPERSYCMNIEELQSGSVKENVDPCIDTEVKIGQSIVSTSSTDDTFSTVTFSSDASSTDAPFDQNATFNIGAGGESRMPGPSFCPISVSAHMGPLLPIDLSENPQVPKFSGYQNRPAPKKLTTSTSKLLARGRSPITNPPLTSSNKKNKITAGTLSSQRGTAGEPKLGFNGPSGPSEQRLNSQSQSNLRWRP